MSCGSYSVESLLFFAADPASAGGLFETREPSQENKRYAVYGPIPLLGDLELRLRALLVSDLAFLFEEIRPVNEKHDVGILLDGARFPQVSELRAALLAFGRPRELA